MLRMCCSDHFLSVVCLSITLSKDNSSKAVEGICLKLGKNVALVEGFKNKCS